MQFIYLKARLAEASQLGLETRYVYRVTQVANLGEGRQVFSSYFTTFVLEFIVDFKSKVLST